MRDPSPSTVCGIARSHFVFPPDFVIVCVADVDSYNIYTCLQTIQQANIDVLRLPRLYGAVLVYDIFTKHLGLLGL